MKKIEYREQALKILPWVCASCGRDFTGKKLRELDLTNQYNIQVIAVRRTGEEHFRFIPKAEHVLYQGDTLVILGTNEELAKLKP